MRRLKVRRNVSTAVPLTRELLNAAAAARRSMRSDLQGTPRPFERQAIYRIMGPLAEPLGRRRRVALDGAAARYVLPVISQAFYDNDPEGLWDFTPDGLLTAAERVLAGGSVDRNVYSDAIDNCKFWLAVKMGGMDAAAKERALFAWLACAATLRTALGDDPFAVLSLDRQTPEGAVGFDDADAARWAAEAVAAEVGAWNVRACRDFWEWWLAEAVPAAWNAETQSSQASCQIASN